VTPAHSYFTRVIQCTCYFRIVSATIESRDGHVGE
jgi:hypothetical protein